MGYLNNQLEKVASVIEGEMEKKALQLGELARMGGRAAARGKALHFGKRLAQRNRALANPANIEARANQFHNAQSKLGDAAYLEQSYGWAGPNSRELARLQGRRIPTDSSTISELTLVSPRSGGLRRAEELLSTPHVPVDSLQLANVVKNLRKGWGSTIV